MHSRLLTAISLIALAAGCGGEDDDLSGGLVPPASYCDITKGWDPVNTSLEEDILVIVNQVRSEGATCGTDAMPSVAPLTMNAELRCAARVHSADMNSRGYFDHENPDGLLPWDRMELAGYEWAAAGENIAGGSPDAAGTMNQWMNSPGHCANIMSSDFEEIGVGMVPNLWTQVFGTSR